ncbi:prolyl oligopeptidase, partial [Chryseobacterium sp. SIMBA_028]
EKVSKLYYREGFLGEEQLLYDPSKFKNSDINQQFVINYISPSLIGDKVAIAMAEKGKELAEVIILDVKSKYIYPEIITNTSPANIGGIKWFGDNSRFFYTYFPVNDPKSPNFYKNTQT